MTKTEAEREAAEIIKDQATEIAALQTAPCWKELPRIAKVGLQREIQRLNKIAKVLTGPDLDRQPG